jgi:Tfp pilus assembly protein FimT
MKVVRSRKSPVRRRAFTVTELIGVVGLIAVLLFIATRLFHQTVRFAHQSSEAGSEANRLDAIVTKLRSDAWTATAATATDGELTFTESADRVARWKVAQDGSLSREVQQGKEVVEKQRWPDMAKGWTFAVKNPEVALKDPVAGELRLLMQLKLLEKTR